MGASVVGLFGQASSSRLQSNRASRALLGSTRETPIHSDYYFIMHHGHARLAIWRGWGSLLMILCSAAAAAAAAIAACLPDYSWRCPPPPVEAIQGRVCAETGLTSNVAGLEPWTPPGKGLTHLYYVCSRGQHQQQATRPLDRRILPDARLSRAVRRG